MLDFYRIKKPINALRLSVAFAFAVGVLASLVGCQLVSKNRHQTPIVTKTDENKELVSNLIEKELLPNLSDARAALIIFDSLRSTVGGVDSLADSVYELEKSFRSTALPESPGEKAGQTAEFLEFQLPFVVGRSRHTLVAKITKNRGPDSFLHDEFGVRYSDEKTSVSRSSYLMGRLYDPQMENPSSFWFFDMPAFDYFLQASFGRDSRFFEEDLSMQFVSTKESLETTVWTPQFRRDGLGIPWRIFQAIVQNGSNEGIQVKLHVLCKEKETVLDFTIKKSTVSDQLRGIVKGLVNSQLESECLIK